MNKDVGSPWSNVYGLARSILAAGTLLTLACNDVSTLFAVSPARANAEQMFVLARLSFFSLFPSAWLEVARWGAIAILLLVISGWRPRLTALPHWWISFSFAASSTALDGGDHITAVLTLLLVPVALADPRRSHWARRAEPTSALQEAGAIFSSAAFAVIRLQVAMIYFIAGVAKLRVAEWENGTALYYWFTHPNFGLSVAAQDRLMPLLANPWIVAPATWAVMVFEVLLFGALFIEKRWRNPLLVAGILFHFGILLVHGLFTFFFATTGALILYLRPVEREFVLPFAVVQRLSVPIRRAAATHAPHAAEAA